MASSFCRADCRSYIFANVGTRKMIGVAAGAIVDPEPRHSIHKGPGPAQLAVYRLKVVKPNEAAVRQALHHLGYSRSRVSQLLAECQQHPPRNWVQRQRQTAQDQPQCIHDDRKN